MHSLLSLGSPAVLVLIALLFAISAYLRQVSENATELMDRIQGDEVPLYPIGAKHTEEKLRALERTRYVLSKVAPFTIWFVILLGLRVVLQAFIEMIPFIVTHLKAASDFMTAAFPFVDFFFVLWFQALLIALYIMHKLSRKRDEKVRQATKAWLESQPRQLTTLRTEEGPEGARKNEAVER